MLKMLMKRFPSVGNAIYQLQTDGNASFLRAARAGNLEKVLEYLKGSIDINTSNANGLNALHLASKEGHVNIVSELLKRGANVNAATKKGNTALHIASLAGQEAVVKILVQSGANVNVQSQNGFTPLYMAAQENHDNVVRFLLANGANQSLATEDGFTPLAVALQQGHDKVVAVLLENDAKGRVRLPALHIAAKKDDCKAAALLLQNDHNPDVTSKSGFTPLHIAAHYGNDNIGRLLLEKGAEINYAAKHQITPLHVASKWGKANMATLLLDKGAKIDAFTRDGLTPLHCAARSGHDHVVDLLLEKGAPITAKTKNGLAPLHMASQGDHVDGARILLYHKAPVDDVTVDYLTALHVAAHCGHVRVAKLLLDRKADPNARALNGFTPLHIACKKNRIKVVELLLKHGASIEARTESGLTPLHVAAFMGNMNIVIFLIQHGADPDIPTVRGETPIHLAARANQADIIRILLRNGARVDAKAREHQTPLHIAARLGNVDIVSLLIQHGAAVDATTKDMYTALHIAAKEGQEEVASVLLDNGASLTATTKKGFTPLHLAAKYGNIKVARLLLQKDAPVDAQGKNGVTPLHVAAHYDHVNVALLLLDKGASPHATAKNGYTPLHIAAKKSQMDIATTLLEYGAKANSESKAGFTPLHLAAQEGHTDMTTLLIEHRADVNMKAKNGLTPLHLCGQEDHVNVAAILVKNDAEIDPETNAGYTPLHVACHFGQVNMVRFLLQHASNVNSITSHGYTPLHQAAQQGHTLIISLLLENKASPNALTNQGQTALSIAKRLGYISVVETLKVVTETTTITTTTTIVEEKYKVVAPETMQETFMSDSEDEGGDEIEDTALFGKPTHATHVYLPYYEGQKLQTREDTILGDQSMRYLTADEMKSLGDDSLPIDVTKDERTAESMLLSADSGAPLTVEEDHLSPLHVRHDIETVFVSNYAADNVDISRAPVHAGKLKWKTFLVSFMVDARGGAMRGCRHSGVRVIIPPRKAPMPMRITCRYLRKEKLTHPPPLMEGEACASRILEIGPVGAKFLGPVIIEVPHFASLRRKEREITILRSDNGEAWREHTLEATEEAVQDVLNESFEGEELNALQDLNTNRITQILTTDFPQYFAIITRVRQEVHAIGPEGGMVSSTVVPQVQAIFPEGALTKKIKVGLQAQPIPPELVSKLLGNRVGVSPIVTVEPRRRKFHKPITLTIPVPQAATKGMINQYSGDAPTLRLLCSITGGVTKAQWEDVTGSTPLTFVNDCVSFTTTVSARFWLMDCRQVNEVTKYATELYREAVHVPFMAKFVVFAKHYEPMEAQLRVFCMTDDKEEKTLESQENFSEVAKSRDVEVLEGKSQFLEFAGNLVPVTKSGEQLALNFQAFRENRLPFIVRVKDPHQESVGRIAFMREPKVSRGEPPQTPICNLNIVLPDICKIEVKPVPTELVTLEKKYGFVEETGLAKPELIHRADLRLSDIARGLDQDWVQLADQLDVSESEVNNIKKEQPNDPVQQALVMLRLWLQQANEDATGNNLEKALRKIGREDIVNSCMFNVEIVTDDVEKAVAKVHLDQSGFDAFKDELGSSRDASLRRDISLDVSYDEQDIMKEAESAEETSSEAGSVHEKQPSTPVEKKPEEVYQLLQQESQKEVKEHQKDELKTEQMMTPTSQEEIVKLKESENMLQVKHIMEQESTLKEVEVEEQKWEELEKPEEIIEDEEDISSFEEVEKPLEHLEFEHIAGSQTPEEVERPLKHLEFEPITGSRPPEEEERFESLEKSLEQVQEGQTFLSVESISKIEAEDEKWEKIEKLDEEFEEEELSPFEKLEELEDQPKEFKFVLEHEIVTEKVGSEQWKKLEKSKDAIIKETEMNPLTESETLLEKKEPLFELESGIEEKRFREPKTMPLNLAEPFVEKQNKEDNILLELEKPIELGIMFAVEPEAVVVKTKTKINMHEEPEKTQEIEIESMIESDLLKKTEVENQKPEKLEEKSAVQKPEMEELLKPVVVFESEPTEEMPGIEVQEFEEQEVKRVVKTIFDKEEIGELEMPVESDLKPIVQTDPIIKTTENIKLEQLEKTIQPEVKPIIETEPILKTTMKEELQQLEKLLETDLTLKTTEKEELEQLKEIVELDVKPMVEFESIIKKSEVKDKIIEELEKPVETEVESMVELEPFVVLIDEEEPKESEQQPKEIVESLKQKIKLVVDSEPTVNLTKENEKEPKEAKPEVKPVVVTDSGIKLPAEVVKELEEIEKTGVPEVEPVVEQEVEPVVKIESVVELIEEEGLEVKELKREVKLVTVNEEDKKIKELEKSVQPEVIPIVETGFVVIQQEEEQTFEQPLKHELIPLVVTDLVIQPPEEEEKRPKKLEKTGEPEINPVIGLEFTIDHQGQEQKLEKFVESEVIPLTEHEAVVDLIDEDLKESKSEVKPIVVTDLGITSLESEFEKLDTTREVEVKPIVGQEPVVEQEPLEQVVKPVVFTNVIIKSPEEKDKMHEELEKLDKPEARSVVEPEFIVDQQEEEEQKLEEFVESVVIPVAELETVVNQEEKEEKLEEVKSVIVFDYVGEPPEKEGKKFEELEKIGESKIKLVIEPERIVKQEGQRFLQSERQEVKHDFVTKLSEEEDKKYEESEKIIEPEVKSMTELELVVDHQQEKQKLGGTVEPIEQKTKLIIQTEPIPNLIEVKKEQTKESKPDIIPLSVTDFDMKSLEDEEKEIKEPDKTGELEVTAIVESEPAIEQEQNKVEEHLKHTGKPVVVTNLGIKSVEEEQKRHEELVKTVDTKVKSVFEPKLVINQQEEQQKLKESVELLGQEYHPVVEPKSVVNITGIEEEPKEPKLKDLSVVGTDFIIKSPGVEEKIFEELEKVVEPKVKPMVEPEFVVEKTDLDKQKLEELEKILELEIKPVVICEPIVNESEVEEKNFEALEKPKFSSIESKKIISVNKSVEERATPDETTVCYDSLITGHPEERVSSQLEPICEIKSRPSARPAAEEPNEEKIMEPTIAEELFDHKSPPLEPKITTRDVDILPESLTAKHTEEIDDRQTTTTKTETEKLLVDDTTKHSITTVTKTTVVHDLGELPPELRDQMIKQAKSEEWSSSEMGSSHVSFSGLPEDEQSELVTISTTLESEVAERKTEVDSHIDEKAWTETDESGAVQHIIQKEKQSTFTVKDGQSESHPGTEGDDTTVSSSVVSEISQELKHEEKRLSFAEKRDFFQKLSETYDSPAKKIDPSLYFSSHDGIDSDIQKPEDYDIQKIQMDIEQYPQKSEIIEEHKSFQERLHFFKTSIGESEQSGFTKENIPTETSTKGMPGDIPEKERKLETDFRETVIKDTAGPESEFSECFTEEYQVINDMGNEMLEKEKIISEFAPKEQRREKKLHEVEENIQEELIRKHNGFALEIDKGISDKISHLSESAKQDVIVKEKLQEEFEEKSVQEISQTSLDENFLVKPKQSITEQEQPLIDWELKELEIQKDMTDKKILSDISTAIAENKYLISSQSKEELKLLKVEECKLKLEDSKTMKEEKSLDIRKTEQTVFEQECFLSESNLENQEVQKEEEMQNTEPKQKSEDISIEKELPISVSSTTEQIQKDLIHCLEEPRSILAEDQLSKKLDTTKLEYTKGAPSLSSESSTESFIQGEQQFSTQKYETINMKKEIEQSQKNVSFSSEEEEREMLEKELEQTSLKDVEQQATSMLSEVSKESLVVEIGTTCDSEKTSEEDELWKEVEDSNESVKKEADSFETDSQSPTEKERLDKPMISDFSKKDESLMKSDTSLNVKSTDLSRSPEQFVQKDETDSKTYREIKRELDKKESVSEIDDKQSVFSTQESPSISLTSQAFALDSTVHQPQVASDTGREPSHIEPTSPPTEHKLSSHEDKQSPLSRPSPPETTSYSTEQEISPAADYTVYLVPEMQVHVGVSPTESKPAASESGKDEEKQVKKLEEDFDSKLVSEPLSETEKKPLTNMHSSSPQKTYSEIQRTEYAYGSKGSESSDGIEDVSSKVYQVHTWTESTHLSEISQGSEIDVALHETPVGYENTAFAGVDVIDEPAMQEPDSGRATSPYEVLRPSTPTLPIGQDKTVKMDQEIFSQFSKQNMDTSEKDSKTHVEHHIKSQIFNEELDLSIEENTPEKKDILEEKSMIQTEVDRDIIVVQQIRSEIFAHELAEDIENDLPEGKDIPYDQGNAKSKGIIETKAYEEKGEIIDQVISRYDINIAKTDDKQVYENEFSQEKNSIIEKSEWEQKSKIVAVEHVMWETSVQQDSEEIIEEEVKELPREKQIIVEHEENESLEGSVDDSEKIESCDKQKDISSEESRDDEILYSLREEATKVAQDIIEDIKTEVSRCHTLEHSLSEISDEDLVEKSEEYMLSHQEVEYLLKTRDKPEEKRVSFSEDMPEIPQITTEEFETIECDQMHTEEEEHKSKLEHYEHLDDQEKGDTCATFKEVVLSSEQKVYQKETVKGEDSYNESKPSSGIICDKQKKKYITEAQKFPNEVQKTLTQATGDRTDNFSQCLSSFEKIQLDDKLVTFTTAGKETKEESANIMTSEIKLFENVTEEVKEKESDLLSTHAEDDEKMLKESIVEKVQKQDYMSSTPIVLDQKQEEKASSKKQLDLSSFSSYTHVEKCISDDFAKTEKDKEIFDMHLTSGEKIQIVEKKLENIQQPGNETVDVSKKTSVKKSESSENITYRDIQSFTQQKETVILDSSEELIQSLYECDQLMKDEKKTASVQKSTINYQSEDSSFESVDLQEKIIMRDQTISEATIKSDVEKKNESDKLDKFISGRTTDLSELSNLTRKEKQISREGETCSSSGETDSHYYSFEMSDSGRTPRETPATSRPCSSEFDINISAPISSEYETCATSQEVSGDISGSYSTAYTSQEISFATAHSSLSHSSRESAISVDSESSGHLASVEVSSEASETLVPSAQEMEQEFGRDIETPTPDDNEMAQAFVVREPYDSEIPEEVIRGGVEVPFLSDWKTKESFEASYPQSSGAIFSQWSNLIEVHEIPSSPFEIITEEDLADYPGDYLEHISESECLDSHKAEESKLKDKHKLEKNSKEIKSDDIIHEHTATDVVVVSETVQSTVGIEGQRSISDEQTPILDGQLFSDEHTLRSFIYRQESGAYLAAESVDDLTDQMSCSQEELSASESSVTHSEQTWLSSSVETTILATEQQTWPCSGAVSQDQQVTETMHIFAEQQFSTHESSDVVSEQPPERSPYPSDLMLYPQVNGPVEVDYVPEYDAPYPESQEQETEVESTFAEGTPTMFAVTGDSNSNDTQDTSEQTSMVEATRNILLSATGISALVPSQVHQPESERVYDESQELQPPTVSLGHTVSEQCSESDSSEGDIQDIQTIQEIQELQEQEYAQEYETCRAEADEVYFQYYQRQYEENEEETQNLPCEVDKTVDWPESELLEEFYESGKIAEVSEDQVDSEIKSVLSHAVESEQEKDLEDIERPMSPEPPDYSSLGENDSYLPESDQGSVFLQQNIPSAQETSLRHTSVTSTTQFPATKIMSESTSADQQLVTHTEGFSRQFQTDSHISESFEIMDKKEVADTKPEEDTYDIITENEIQTVSSIEKSSSSKIQQGDIMEESLLSKAQRSCGQQSLAESHIATAVSEKFTIQAHQAYKHDIEQDSNFQSKNVMEEDKDGRPSGQKVTYTYGIQFERKQEHDLEEDSFGELYTHREEDEDGFEEIERASKTKPSSCEKIHSSDLNAFAGKKYISKSEQEDGSVSSLQEFENLESGVTIGEKSSLGLVDLVIGKTVLSKSGEVDDISLCSQTEFEQLEKECEEVEHAATKEDFSKSSEIKESYHVQDITEDAESSESDDYEKRMSEIDEIIRQAQTNVEQFHADHDQSLSESAGFTIKLQKYTGTLSSESTESSLMEKTSSQKDDHDIDSLNGNGVLERQVSVEGHMLETNEQSIVHELETRPALPQHIIIGRTVSGHSAESCDSQPRSSTSTVTQYDIESLREREAELEETEAVGDLKSRLFIDQRVEKYGTLEEDKDFMHEEFDHSFHEDSIYEKKEIHAEESSLLSDKSADVDSLLEEKADKDSLQEERDVDQDSLHEEMDLPDDQEAILPGAQKASEQVIIKSSWHQRHLSEDECDKDSLKDEHITGQDTSSSGKDGQGSGGKGDCMISSTDSLEPSSSTATHATYQFETDSVMSSSVNSVHTSGEESTMVSSTDTIEPEVVLSYSVGDMSEATESHKIFSRDQVESHLQLKSEIRSLVKDADKNYKTVISQSMTQPSQLIICLSEESTKPRMSHDVEQVLGKDAETFSAGKSSEVYEEVEAKDESENQVVIHSVEKDIVWQEKLDSTESETDIEEKVKDVIEKQVTGVNDGDETQKDHPTDEKGNLVITKMIKQHLTSEPQVMTYLDEETPESGVASYVKKSFEADKNIAVIQKPSESVEEIETIDASGNQVIICHIKNNITCEANRDITDSERVVEKHLKDFIPKQTIDIDYGDDEVEGHPSVDEKGTVVITKTIKELLNSEPQGPEETLTCQLVTHLDDKTFESGSTSDAVETFKAEKDASIAFKDEPSEMLEEIKTTGVKRNILYEPTISSTDKIEEKLKDLLKEQTLGVGKDHEEVEEHQKVDEKGNVIITRTVKRHVTSEPQIHKKTFMGPDAEKQTKEFFQSFDSLKPTEDEDHYEGVDDEGNMIRVTQKFVVKPEIHTVTFTGPDAHKQMEYFMKTWSESQDGERDSNDAHCHRLNVYTNDSSGEKISSSQAEPQDTQSPPVSSVYFCASSLSKMLDSDDHEHSSSYQTDEGLESDPVFHLKTQEPTSTAGQMLDRGTQQFHFRDVSDGVPLPAASTRHTVYRQDDRTVHFDPREYDHEFHSKFPSHFTCAEEEKEEFGSGHWQQDSGDGHWTGQSTTEARSETTCTSTTVGADGQRCTVTETTTQYGDIEKHGSLQQSMQEILNQFMTDEGSSQTAYHFDDDKE
ncbi:ankyrin-2-like isoform X3 [Limulus polyphemus]|uniref:Ankyrin-2-like isoform X3 n=1 Tax=Limulus polyphemus TaxID=6850 RepID=A0ABM1BCQ4_LIMPO|nr:ankyrin-2-like isoform X3 [Limulus polyphemus]